MTSPLRSFLAPHRAFLVSAALALLMLPVRQGFAQTTADWSAWKFLIGAWEGEGSGKPGTGAGTFGFSTDLQGTVLVRRSETRFAATKDRPASVHEDLLTIYRDHSGAFRGDYYDNEGHVIRYTAVAERGTIVLTSELQSSSPRFRLTYRQLPQDRISVLFEMAPAESPEAFRVYLEGTARRSQT